MGTVLTTSGNVLAIGTIFKDRYYFRRDYYNNRWRNLASNDVKHWQ